MPVTQLDLLIDTRPDTSLLDIAQIQVKLEALLGYKARKSFDDFNRND
jgi:predicted nucleotidyltransferase